MQMMMSAFVVLHQQGGGVGAHCKKPAVADGNEARIAGQHAHTLGGHDVDDDQCRLAQHPVFHERHRRGDRSHQEQGSDGQQVVEGKAPFEDLTRVVVRDGLFVRCAHLNFHQYSGSSNLAPLLNAEQALWPEGEQHHDHHEGRGGLVMRAQVTASEILSDTDEQRTDDGPRD